jgi:hypothetical protein
MNFSTGLIAGIAVTIFFVSSETKTVEVLPENYAIVTSLSDGLCSGPTGKTNIVQTRVRTQTVNYSGN